MRGQFVLLLIYPLLTGGYLLHAQEKIHALDPQVKAGEASRLRNLIPAEQLEVGANQQYQDLLKQARAQGALAPNDYPELLRLRKIAGRIIPYTNRWNNRAQQWHWEVNLIGSKQLNAFCMPGGKIAFYTGLIEGLKLTDDEIAMVMGHEIAHALREHARERIAKTQLTGLGANLVSQIFGLGNLGQTAVGLGANLLTLKFSREDETDADLVGLDIAARAGYDPRAALILWQKMNGASKGAPPQWLSTHPAGNRRIQDLQTHMPEALAIYARVRKTSVEKLPPYQSNP